MSRDDILKAAAAGLQPKSLDLTQYAKAKSASLVRETRKVSNADAGYALGFAAGPITVPDKDGRPGETYQGDELAVVLLRLKYAAQLNLAGFERALLLLVHRYGGLGAKPMSETTRACAAAALVEWLNDACPKCRPPRTAGVFAAMQGRGMVCVPCRNSGRTARKPKQRWQAVSELLRQVQRERGFEVNGIAYKTFMDHWHARLERFVDILRATDRRMGATIDFGMAANDRNALGIDADETTSDNTRDGVGSEE